MITTKFAWLEDQMTGEMGWIPKSNPGFNATSGFGLAHDVMEHFRNDVHGLDAEMRAFGAMIFVRWEGGWQPYRGVNMHSPAYNIASGIFVFLQNIACEQDTITTPPKTNRLHEDVEEILDEAISKSFKDYLNYEDCNTDDTLWIRDALEHMRGWMRIGYRKAVKRYKDLDVYEATALFNEIERQTYKLTGEYGDELIVRVSPKQKQVYVRVISPNYEY
jgi:hypothetical protein